MAGQTLPLEARNMIDTLLNERAGNANVKTLTEALIDEYGGVAALAREHRNIFTQATGSLVTQSKMIGEVFDLIKAVAGKDGGGDPLANLDREQMEALLKTLVKSDGGLSPGLPDLGRVASPNP